MNSDIMRKIIWWLETIAKIGILTVGFLEACSVTFGKPIISYVLWPTVILGGFLLFIRLINYKHYWKTKNLWLLFAFCISYLLSAIMNVQYGWYNNIRTLVWTAFLFFLVYCYYDEETFAQSKKQFNILSAYYLIFTAALSIASFVFMITGYAKVFYQDVGPIYYIGFHWGRLYGAYWDANIGALMGCVSIILSLGLCRNYRNKVLKIVLAVNIILEVFYIAFSDSRTGILCLCVALPLYTFLVLIRKKKSAAILCAVGILLVSYCIPVGIKNCYNAVINVENQEEHVENTESVSGTAAETIPSESNVPETDKSGIGRVEEYSGDISNRRFDIWKSAVQLFRASPMWGVSHNNVLQFVEKNIPDSYLITNDHMKFESMHNGFLDILVGQGIIGFGIYIVMAAIFLICIIKNWKRLLKQSAQMGACWFAIVAAIFTATFVMTEIVYVTSPMSTMFWIALGMMMKTIFLNEDKSEKMEGAV